MKRGRRGPRPKYTPEELATMTHMVCNTCEEEKPLDCFPLAKQTAVGRSYECKPCNQTYRRERLYLARPAYELIKAAKTRAARQEVSFDLDDHEDKLAEIISKGCQLTGIAFRVKDGGPRSWNSASIDRIEAGGGYTFDNVRVILWSLNTAFNSWGEDQFEQVARAWLARKD